MKNNISNIIVTLSSLYELLLKIGQSFDIQENAEAFLKTLMLQQNLAFAAYYTLEHSDVMTKVHSIPKTEIEHNKLDATLISALVQEKFNILKESDSSFNCISQLTKLPQKEFVVYFAGAKSILVLGKKNDSFDRHDLIKSELVLNKFGLFMESLESHHRIKDEIKIKEEQAKIIRQNNEKLKKQNDDLMKYIQSNNELEKFAYRVAHDIKSPLNTIISFSKLFEMTSKGNMSEEQTEFLKYIVDAGTQMGMLISGILDYSKINGDELKLKRINVYQLIEKIRNLLYHNLSETNGKIIVNDLPEFIIADETKIKQVFLNLITNALKFKKKNVPPEVIINGDAGEHEFTFSISDNGIGIPEESKEKVFELFSKAQNNHHFDGHGIGLSTCQQIVNQHTGEIWIESELDVGTIFYFTIQKVSLPLEIDSGVN